MPYDGEYAHYQPLKRIVESERVQQLLRRSRVIDRSVLVQQVAPKPPPQPTTAMPALVLAIDGSTAEVDVRNGYPGAKVGYCSVASVIMNLAEVERLDASRPVNPIDFRRDAMSSRATTFPRETLSVKPSLTCSTTRSLTRRTTPVCLRRTRCCWPINQRTQFNVLIRIWIALAKSASDRM